MKEKFYGSIEVDESCFGDKRQRVHGKRRRGRGTLKQPVFGIFVGHDGRVYTELVPDCRKQTLQALALGKFPWEASSIQIAGEVMAGWWLRDAADICGSITNKTGLRRVAGTLTGLKVFGVLPKEGLPSLME